MPVIKAILSLVSTGMTFLTFYYVHEASPSLNTGVFTSLFCSSILYSSILLYFIYGQKLKKREIFGMMLIVICIILIALSNEKVDKSHEAPVIIHKYLVLATVMALLTGLEFGIGVTITKVLLMYFKFPPYQLTFDIMLAVAIILFPVFIW